MTRTAIYHPTIAARLTELARKHHPGAQNWWREQSYQDRKAARCLICGHVMHTWPADKPVPFAANSSIVSHYEYHAIRLLVS